MNALLFFLRTGVALFGVSIYVTDACAEPKPEQRATPEVRKYLSDTDDAYKFLERLQASVCGRDPTHSCSPEKQERLEKLYSQLNFPKEDRDEIIKLILRDNSTRFEGSGNFWLLSQLYKEVKDAAVEVGMKVETDPAFGAFPSKSINAQFLVYPGIKKPIITFNVKMFELAHEMAKTVLETMIQPVQGGYHVNSTDDGFRSYLSKDPSILEYFIRLSYEFLLFEKTQHRFPKTDLVIESRVRHGLELFILAHEFGHLTLKHRTSNVEPLEAGLTVGVETVSGAKSALWSWRQEMQADAVGHRLMRRIVERSKQQENSQGAELLSLGPLFYFKLREMLSRAGGLINDGDESKVMPTESERATYVQLSGGLERVERSDSGLNEVGGAELTVQTSHPPSTLRLETARKHFDNMVRDGLVGTEVNALSVGIERRIELFVQAAQPIFKRLHAAGTRIQKRTN